MAFLGMAYKMDRAINKLAAMAGSNIELRDGLIAAERERQLATAARVISLQFDLRSIMLEEAGRRGLVSTVKWAWHVTIRPDQTTDFAVFYAHVRSFLDRRTIEPVACTFEQKGDMTNLGSGFHAHMVVRMIGQGGKDRLLDWAAATVLCAPRHMIKIDKALRPDNLIQGYFIDYESQDGHKLATKSSDAAWRAATGLEPLYRGSLPPLRAAPLLSIQDVTHESPEIPNS